MTRIRFPDREFTIDELEKLNPNVPPEKVRAQLAQAIFDRVIEFVPLGDERHLVYRKGLKKP